MSNQKYYLVKISIPPGPDDDNDHGQLFQVMMTEAEFEIGQRLEDLKSEDEDEEEYDDDEYPPTSYTLNKLCKVTKEEYNRFRPLLEMSYANELMSDIHSKLEEKEDRKNKKKKGKGKQDRSGKKEENYYLVNVDTSGGDSGYGEYKFFAMLTEEELQAAKILEKKKAAEDGDEVEQQFYPGDVEEICTVTKQEYEKFSKLLKGEFSEDFLDEVQVQMERQEDAEVNKKRRKKHSMTGESKGEDNDDEEEEDDEHSGMEEEDDEEISEGQTRKKAKT